VAECVPIAIDESLAEDCVTLEDLKDFDQCVIIVKPMIHGYCRSKQIICWAMEHGKRVILSSCFESSVGIAHYALLAAEMENNEFHGLNTSSRLEKDIFEVKEDLSTLSLLELLNREAYLDTGDTFKRCFSRRSKPSRSYDV